MCGKAIAVGEKYIARVGTDGGILVNMRMHPLCEEVSQTYTEDDWLAGTDFHEFEKELKEYQAKKVKNGMDKADTDRRGMVFLETGTHSKE